MIRRFAFSTLTRVLLSLVLLLSQQMATSHALSHWTSRLGGPLAEQVATESELSSAFAQDRSCAQCLGLAQLGAPLPNTPRHFVPPELRDVLAIDAAALEWRLGATRLYDSRAPPVLG